MRKIMYAAAALSMLATALPAQTPKSQWIELRPYVGASIPTGTQRDLFSEEPIFGLQAAFEVKPTFHVVGSFGWVPADAKYAVTNAGVDIFQYDLGVELSFVRPMGGKWLLKPFAGLGAGARSYVFAADELKNKTCMSGYGALGSEFQLGRTALRFEARDNVFCYRSPIAGIGSKTRNDVGLALGVAYHF